MIKKKEIVESIKEPDKDTLWLKHDNTLWTYSKQGWSRIAGTVANEADIQLKADKSELSNVLAEEPLTPDNFPDIGTYTREELKKDLFRDMWLATLDCFPLLPTYEQDVAATLPDGSQYGLNGLVMDYDTALNVRLWSKPFDNVANSLFSYDYTMSRKVVTVFPFMAPLTDNYQNAWRACSYLKALSVYSQSGAKIAPVSAINLFVACRNLETIYGEIDFGYISNQGHVVNAFLLCYKLRTLRLTNLKVDISFYHSPELSLESLNHMVGHAANMSAITITVNPVVYSKLTDENNTEWHALLALAAEKNINFATT